MLASADGYFYIYNIPEQVGGRGVATCVYGPSYLRPNHHLARAGTA